jgi:hypothetical protein
MIGKGRHPILGVWSPDPVLSTVAPIGLAASVGTALVVDLVSIPAGGARTLADIVAEGPKLSELSPVRTGIALLAGGRVAPEPAFELLDQLARNWPALVVRLPGATREVAGVPVMPLYPGKLAPVALPSPGVWQPVGGGSEPPGPGPVMPPLRAGTIRRLLSGQLPRRNRWVSAWRPIWEMPWA